MIFKDKAHEEYYKEFLSKDNTRDGDSERKSLFYLLSLLDTTRDHIEELYDFKNHWIDHKALDKDWQTGSSAKITSLAFNLYNGWNDEKGYCTPLNLFCVSANNIEYLLEAIRIRFS